MKFKRTRNVDFPDVDRYFSIKVLSIAGRAITQSRYNCWENKSEQIRYLHDIRNDDYFKKQCFNWLQ